MTSSSPPDFPSGTVTWHLAVPPFFGFRGRFSSVIFSISSTHFLYNLSTFLFSVTAAFLASSIFAKSSFLILTDFSLPLFLESLVAGVLDFDFSSFLALFVEASFLAVESFFVVASFLVLVLIFFFSSDFLSLSSRGFAFLVLFLSLVAPFALVPSLVDLFLFFLKITKRI